MKTAEEQIKAIAELDGYKEYYSGAGFYVREGDPTYHWLPDYLASRDAIIPVIEKQSYFVKERVAKLLGCKNDYCAWISVTPSQLAEALLRAKGLWKD